jgi:hypothetical protein
MTAISRGSTIVATNPETNHLFVCRVEELPTTEEEMQLDDEDLQSSYLMTRVIDDPDFQTESSLTDGTYKTVKVSDIDVELTESI